MLFNLKPDTECELTTFVGRTQKAGKEDVPAVSFRLRLASVRNELLDLFSPTMRLTVYAPVEGQEQLPDLEEARKLGGAQALFDKEMAEHEAFRKAHPAP